MDKSVDTQWMSARQILLLAPAGSPIRDQVLQALRPPQYIVLPVDDADVVAHMLREHKIEVVLVEPEAGRTRSAAAMDRLRQADPFAQIVLLAPRATLTATMMAVAPRPAPAAAASSDAAASGERPLDLLGVPFSPLELVQAVEHAREIRYLRRADERGRRAEARMSAVVRSAPNAIVSLDAAGVIHDWNPAAETTFGWPAAEAVGRDFWELAVAAAPAELRGDRPGTGAPLARDGGTVRTEIVGRRRDGAEFPAMISLAAVASSERPMCCAIIEDVTGARQLELGLRHAQKLEAVGKLASGLAHEINTPCQVIGANREFLSDAFAALDQLVAGLGELARRAAGDAAGDTALAGAQAAIAEAEEEADLTYLRQRVPRALADVAAGTHRIARIVAAMKDFAQAGVPERTPVDLNRSLASTLMVLEAETAPVAEVVTDFGPVPPVLGYAADLNQALLQIVLNAAQAVADRQRQTGVRGRITVRTRAEAGGTVAAVDVIDTGVGIAASIRDRIFEPFFTTKEVGRGTGQGLSVARAIVVDRHGGALTFTSEVDAGTTFHLTFPALSALEARG